MHGDRINMGIESEMDVENNSQYVESLFQRQQGVAQSDVRLIARLFQLSSEWSDGRYWNSYF